MPIVYDKEDGGLCIIAPNHTDFYNETITSLTIRRVITSFIFITFQMQNLISLHFVMYWQRTFLLAIGNG